MISRVAAVSAAVAMVILVASGCQPEPAPSPSAAAFATEAEAFAAAEETYRAYVDALNQVDLSDPETFEAVYAWTTGDANAGEKKSLTRMHADGWTVTGKTLIKQIHPFTFDATAVSAVVLQICSDVSGVQVLDADGESVVAPDRPSIQASAASFLQDTSSPTGLLISNLDGSDHSC
jgi:hypothetical protein